VTDNVNTEQGGAAAGAPAAGQQPSSPYASGAPRQEAPGGTTAGDFDAAQGAHLAAQVDRTAQLSPSEIQALAKKFTEDPKSEYYKGGPDHDYQVAVAFRARELAAEAAGEQGESFSTTTMLANRAIQISDLPIPKENMNPKLVEQDADMRNALVYFDRENISTPLVKEMLSEYANQLAMHGDMTDKAIATLEQRFAGRLHPQQASLLKKWLKEELGPNIRRNRRGR
jgi:hypothetical protein